MHRLLLKSSCGIIFFWFPAGFYAWATLTSQACQVSNRLLTLDFNTACPIAAIQFLRFKVGNAALNSTAATSAFGQNRTFVISAYVPALISDQAKCESEGLGP